MEALPDLWIVAALVATALAAGFMDAIAGGGGLVTIPALLLSGLSPITALATNKLQGSFGALAATLTYARGGHFEWRSVAWMAVAAGLGSAVGAFAARLLSDDVLRIVMPVALVAIALYFAFKPNLDDTARERRVSAVVFGLTAAPAVGFYDGIFGPGAGSFYMLAFVALAGMGVLRATAHTKLLNLSSNLAGLAVFAWIGAVHWRLGLLMGAAQMLGAWIGARTAMRIGSRLIKPLLVTVCIVLAARLLMDPAHPFWR